MTKTFTVVPLDKGNGNILRVHKLGCRDIGKFDHQWNIEGKNLKDAIGKQLKDFQDQDMHYTENDFRVMPCNH